MFPEGTRGGEERVQPFKKGGFHLARKANVPIVPIGIRGTYGIMTRDELVIHPGIVHVHIGDPIPPAEFPDEDSMSDAVRARISELADMPLAG